MRFCCANDEISYRGLCLGMCMRRRKVNLLKLIKVGQTRQTFCNLDVEFAENQLESARKLSAEEFDQVFGQLHGENCLQALKCRDLIKEDYSRI